MKLLPKLVALVIILLVGSEPAWSSWGALRVPARYRSWTLTTDSGDEVTFSQTYAPVVFTTSFSSRGDLVISTSASSSTYDQAATDVSPGTEESLGAGSDVVLQATYRLSESFLVQGGVNLPTGKTELTVEEFSIVQQLSHPLFGFPLWQHGQGLNLSAGIAWVTQLSNHVEAGLGVGGVIHGEYQLLQGREEQYEPGQEIAISGGITAGDDQASQFAADVTHRTYGEDKAGGEVVYEQGAQTEVQVAARTQWGEAWVPYAGLRGVFKQDSVLPETADVESLHEAPGNTYMADFGLGRRFSQTFQAGIAVSVRSFSGSETIRQDGTAFGIGPTIQILSKNSGTLELSPQWWTGTLDENDIHQKTDLSGWSVLLSYRLQGR